MPCHWPYSGGSSYADNEPLRLALAFAHSAGARQPLGPHTGLRVVSLTKLHHSLYVAARHLACPASGQDFYDRAFVRSIALPHVGYDYMNSRFVHDQTFTGYSGSLVGCTQNHKTGAILGFGGICASSLPPPRPSPPMGAREKSAGLSATPDSDSAYPHFHWLVGGTSARAFEGTGAAGAGGSGVSCAGADVLSGKLSSLKSTHISALAGLLAGHCRLAAFWMSWMSR
jgi:hypothetical protein